MRISVSPYDLYPNGLTIGVFGDREVVRYRLWTPGGKKVYVFCVMEHTDPQSSRISGFYNDEEEALKIAMKED